MTVMRASSVLAFAYALAATSAAHAHAPAKVLQFLSTDPEDVVVATTRGIIFGNTSTRDFKLLCNEAYGVSPAEETVRLARLTSGRLLVASSDGLQRSDDQGCTWQPAPGLSGVSVPSLAQHPTDPDRVYISTYTASAGPREGTVRVTTDGGETFTTLLTVGDEFLRGIEIIPTDPAQIYLTGLVLDAQSSTEFVARSRDGGETWERNTILLEMMERDVKLLAVNHANPDELLLRATGPEPGQPQRLLYSSDGGSTFRSLGTVRGLEEATFSADGTVAYVAGLDGVQRVAGDERVLEAPTTSARISQVRERADGQLLAAGFYEGIEAGTDGVGIAPASSLVFERFLDFNEVDEQLACSAEVEKLCAFLWMDWQLENPPKNASPDEEPDAGSNDGGTSADTDAGAARDGGGEPEVRDGGTPANDADAAGDEKETTTDASTGATSDDGCSVAGGSRGLGPALSWLAALALVQSLRRRRRTR